MECASTIAIAGRVYFHDGVIVRVRGYLDSAIVARFFEENPSMPQNGRSRMATRGQHLGAVPEGLHPATNARLHKALRIIPMGITPSP
jgi:hypothetical protein